MVWVVAESAEEAWQYMAPVLTDTERNPASPEGLASYREEMGEDDSLTPSECDPSATLHVWLLPDGTAGQPGDDGVRLTERTFAEWAERPCGFLATTEF